MSKKVEEVKPVESVERSNEAIPSDGDLIKPIIKPVKTIVDGKVVRSGPSLTPLELLEKVVDLIQGTSMDGYVRRRLIEEIKKIGGVE